MSIINRLIALQGWRSILLLIVIGGISSLTFPPTYCIPILFFTFPLLILRIDQAKSGKNAFAQGYWFGFGLHTIGLSWLINAILIRAEDFWWLVPIVSPACAVLLAFWTGLVALIYHWIAPKGWGRIALFAGLWTICDMSRAILLPPTWWNPILTGFPWNPLGSSWEIPGKLGDVFSQLASVIGVDGLTFVTLLIVLSPLCGRKGMVTALCGLVVWIGFGTFRVSKQNPASASDMPIVALIQGNVAEDDKINNTDPQRIFQNYMELTQQGVAKAIDIQAKEYLHHPIIFAWPESAFPGAIQLDNQARNVLMQSNPQAAAGFIGAVMFDDKKHLYNSLVTLNPQGDINHDYAKSKLVPFGESQPWYIPFHVVPGQTLTPGSGVKTIDDKNIASFGPLICYEVIFSGQVVDENHRPQWLLNVTNDAWYGNSAGPRQHLAAVKLRAIEEGLPIVRVANTGISAVFDPYGREMLRIGWDVRGTAAITLPGAIAPTIFSYGGRLLPLILAGFAVLLGIISRKKRNYSAYKV